MTDWKLGQYVRVWKNEGYEYGHIETMPENFTCPVCDGGPGNDCQCSCEWESAEVMLVGDDGKEIYCQVKDLEAE